MPNHIHVLWKINIGFTLVEVQREFLKFTSQKIQSDLKENHPLVLEKFRVNLKDRKYQFWERNSKSKFLPSRSVVEQKLDYMHNNLVQGKWMLADDPSDYKYSSIRFYEGGIMNMNF
jgi:REP element-mobilizing transposase RayT